MKIILLLFILTSCNAIKTISGGDTEINDDFFQVNELVIDYEGNWLSECVSDGIKLDYFTQLNFTNGVYNTDSIFFTTSSDCLGAQLLTDSGMGDAIIDRNNITMRVISRDITPDDTGIVTSFNSTTECGINSWTYSVATDVLGIDCLGRTRNYLGEYNLNIQVIDENTIIIDGTRYSRQ